MGFLAGLGSYAFPVLIVGVPVFAYAKGVPVYETFVKGAEEGLKVAINALPYIVAIFAAISLFRGSGALAILSRGLAAVLEPAGVPPEVVPLMAIRPISGSGALALTGDLLRAYGPDSPIGVLASILQGATDTTFYVVTLYFGSVGIKRTRRALLACLAGDACGFAVGLVLWRAMVK